MYEVHIKEGVKLTDYAAYASLLLPLTNFQTEASSMTEALKGQRIWMINSTKQGGGVAEMMPRIISLLQQLGMDAHWLIMESEDPSFFAFTKKLHNLIHGTGEAHISSEEKALFQKVSEENAQQLLAYVKPHDIVVIHDPQPVGIVSFLMQQIDHLITVWRCHIGLDCTNAQTQCAWDFLKPFLQAYDHHIFSAPEYIPESFSGNVTTIYPSIDPLTHKNRELSIHKLTGILSNAGLLENHHPTITPSFTHPVKRLHKDGTFGSVPVPDDLGLLFRPIITQVSRWDALKGFLPLMQGFVYMKEHMQQLASGNRRILNSLQRSRLVLAGPDPDFVSDDPEGQAVLREVSHFYLQLPAALQAAIAVLKLPMHSVKENALIVNALQRCSYVVAQNSIQEGFGLTASEAMWKRIPVLGSSACGLRHQVRDGIDGYLVKNPEEPQEIADRIYTFISEPKKTEKMGFSAQKRVLEKFLTFHQMSEWLRVFHHLLQQQRALT